jgi:hypothetical protein
MSFGFVSDQKCIIDAIYRSLHKRSGSLLFFAAASNFGANDQEMFPARHPSVISVRGTNTKGVFQDFNPPRDARDGVVFGTLGLEVPGASLSCNKGEVCKSGTSMATAVMVGLTGMLLGYVEGKHNKVGHETVRKKLRTRRGMLALLHTFAKDSLHDRYAYIAPWKLLDKDDELRWSLFEVALADVS